ncbi:MAG: porin family protein [Flavobacteriaceae bacterium]
MKRIIILSIFFSLFIGSKFYAQSRIINLPNEDKKDWNFGYYLGINKYSFVIDYKESLYPETNVVIDAGYGFNVGVVAERNINKNFSIRFEPGISNNVKQLYFNNKGLLTQNDSLRKVSSTYLRLPFYAKFSTDRLDNIRPYVVTGASYDYNFSNNEKNPDDNTSGEFRMKAHNFMYEVGVGIDIYMSFFKFSPSIRGVFAMNNELVPDNVDATSAYTGPIDNFATRGIFLKFTFE